jgi:hypothetical protein
MWRLELCKMNFFDYILFSQRRPPYKNEQEHSKPANVLTHCPCLPQTIFAKHKSSTISKIKINISISFF